MLTRLLVPLDGSALAEHALFYASAVPSEHVRLLTVLPPGSGDDPSIENDWRPGWRKSFEERLDSAAESLRGQNRIVQTVIDIGDPADSILEQSKDADMIIMTTRGYGSGHRVIFGSVADRIARSSTTPVMFVRIGNDGVTAQPIVRIVVGLDGSSLAEQALPFAVELAEALEVPIQLVRVVDMNEWGLIAQFNASPVSRYAGSPEAIRHAAQQYLERVASNLNGSDVVVEISVIDGDPATALDDFLLPGDVMMLTSHGRGGIRRWLLGSVAGKLIRQGNTPVIVVRAKPESES